MSSVDGRYPAAAAPLGWPMQQPHAQAAGAPSMYGYAAQPAQPPPSSGPAAGPAGAGGVRSEVAEGPPLGALGSPAAGSGLWRTQSEPPLGMLPGGPASSSASIGWAPEGRGGPLAQARGLAS